MVEHRLGIPLSSSESESEDELEFSENLEKNQKTTRMIEHGRQLRVLCHRINLANYRIVPVKSEMGESKDVKEAATNNNGKSEPIRYQKTGISCGKTLVFF